MKIFSYLIILLFSLPLLGQDNQRYSEDDVALQGKFVRATQKKLLRKYDDALEIYESILKQDMHNSTALFDMSRIYLKMDKKEEAIEYGKKAIKKDPKNQWFKESLAEIYMAFESFDDAAEMYTELIQKNKEKESHYVNAIDAFNASENLKGALDTYQKMESNLGVSAYTSEQIIALYLNLELYNEAIIKAKELANNYPNDPYFISLNAELEKDFGSDEEATRLYKKVLQLDPENSKALVYLAGLGASNSELETVLDLIQNKNVDIDAKIKALIPFAKEITSSSENKDQIVEAARQIVQIHQEEAKAHALLGDILKNSGNPSEAIDAYSNSLRYDKSVFAIWQELMFLQYEAEQYEELGQTSMNAIDFYPNQAAPYAFHGLSQSHTGNLDEAKEMLLEAQIIGTKDNLVMAVTKLLEVTTGALEEGFEMKTFSKEDLFMHNIQVGDERILYQRSDGKYVVKMKRGS